MGTLKLGDRVRVPFGDRMDDATVSYVGPTCVTVLIQFNGSDEPTQRLYRVTEIERVNP
ncbi:hypothetical protein [Nocardia farcinica]|uniref:hypothetical protein n=1 Tax=Nocardia farcinica TaxID=37329 RepID=UPI0003211F43|nr:hypothetical protein [Nocardia farcinica]